MTQQPTPDTTSDTGPDTDDITRREDVTPADLEFMRQLFALAGVTDAPAPHEVVATLPEAEVWPLIWGLAAKHGLVLFALTDGDVGEEIGHDPELAEAFTSSGDYDPATGRISADLWQRVAQTSAVSSRLPDQVYDTVRSAVRQALLLDLDG